LEEIKERFPQVNATVKILSFLEKGLIEEMDEKYVTKLHTKEVKKIIDESNISKDIKKNFHFFLSQIDNPFVRQNIFNTDARLKVDFILSIMTKSFSKEIDSQELRLVKLSIEDLMNKLR